VLGAELEASGVRVVVVDPGDMNTEMHRAAEPGVDLSHLPGPEVAVPAFVRLLDGVGASRVRAQEEGYVTP
jgi:NAD(P)-dependent dehydrogenase (short-subunit alcohol dehydrogenase family)